MCASACVQSGPQVSVGMCVCLSVGLIGGKQRGVHRLHAGGAGEGSHQPVVYTVHVVDVHAGQEPDRVPIHKVHHTDDTPVKVNTDTHYIHQLNKLFFFRKKPEKAGNAGCYKHDFPSLD